VRLTRRDFLRATGITGAGLFFGCDPGAPSILPGPGPAFVSSVLHGTRAEIDDEPLTLLAGTVPRDMQGLALVVGGVPYGDGTPLFTGDGMIARFSFAGGDARVKTRLVRTDDFLLDEAAGSDPMLRYRSSGMVRISAALGARDFANTALVASPSGRLVATYDAGRPWEIDPRTLDCVGPVGMHASWRPMLPPISPGLALFPVNMSTAHPVWDPDEDVLYAVNWAPPLEGLSIEPFTRVMRWSGSGEPEATDLVDETGAPAVIEQSCHQIHTTRRYVVISDGAFSIEPEQLTGSDVTRPQRPTTVLWIVPKSALTAGGRATARRVEIPIESAHFLVARDDSGDRLEIALMHQNSADPSEWIRASDTIATTGEPVDPSMVGAMVGPADLTVLGRYRVDATTGAVDASATRVLEDPRLFGITLWARDERDGGLALGEACFVTMGFDPRTITTRIADAYRDHPHRVMPLSELPSEPLPAHFLRVDQSAMQIADALELPLGWLPMSPTFVPRSNAGPGEGYVVSVVLGPEGDEVWILDAQDLARGPLARLSHPRLDVGFSLHTTWLPELVAPPARMHDRVADYGEAAAALSPEARELVRRVLGVG
jgi:carotenoid cleavage dioxygenase-like enzyme